MRGIVVLRTAFAQEWRAAAIAHRAGVLYQAFSHLERAHILSQRITWWLLRCHLAMLHLGWLRRAAREVIGQVKRVFAALLFSRIRVPAANTGGTNRERVPGLCLSPTI